MYVPNKGKIAWRIHVPVVTSDNQLKKPLDPASHTQATPTPRRFPPVLASNLSLYLLPPKSSLPSGPRSRALRGPSHS